MTFESHHCGLHKQMLGTNGNQLTIQSGYISITAHGTWPEHLLSRITKSCGLCSHKTHNKYVINSPWDQTLDVDTKQSAMASTLRAEGMPSRMKERGVKFPRLHTPATKGTLGTCTQPSTRNHVWSCSVKFLEWKVKSDLNGLKECK